MGARQRAAPAHRTEQTLWMRAKDPWRSAFTRSGCGSLSRIRDCSVEGPRGAKPVALAASRSGELVVVGDGGVDPWP